LGSDGLKGLSAVHSGLRLSHNSYAFVASYT
jgi:hypothetical protein